jgi:hypothetical protein
MARGRGRPRKPIGHPIIGHPTNRELPCRGPDCFCATTPDRVLVYDMTGGPPPLIRLVDRSNPLAQTSDTGTIRSDCNRSTE